MYILFFSALARELNEPTRARKWAEPSRLCGSLPYRAELTHFPPLLKDISCMRFGFLKGWLEQLLFQKKFWLAPIHPPPASCLS
jgi:hypothetical protein